MNRLAKSIAMLGAVVIFCLAMLIGLLRKYSPAVSLSRAAIAAGITAVMLAVLVQIGISVLRDGLRIYKQEHEAEEEQEEA